MAIQNTLVKCILRGRGKAKLEAFLRQTKQELELPRAAFKTSGSHEDLQNAVDALVDGQHISISRLREIADDVEENGAQHVFLFRLTPAGAAALTADAFAGRFPLPPANATEDFYSNRPAAHIYFTADRSVNGGLVSLTLKQIHIASFWEIDKQQSERTPTRRVTVRVLRRRRAVNLFRVFPGRNEVEVRIDQLKGSNDERLAIEQFSEFLDTLAPIVDPALHLEAVGVKSAFPLVVAAIDETYMSTDRADKAAVHQAIANRRAANRGPDVRLHPDYSLAGPGCARDSLNIFWRMPADNDALIHSVISAVDINGAQHTKVWISGKVSAEELSHAIGRVRHFAALAP